MFVYMHTVCVRGAFVRVSVRARPRGAHGCRAAADGSHIGAAAQPCTAMRPRRPPVAGAGRLAWVRCAPPRPLSFIVWVCSLFVCCCCWSSARRRQRVRPCCLSASHALAVPPLSARPLLCSVAMSLRPLGGYGKAGQGPPARGVELIGMHCAVRVVIMCACHVSGWGRCIPPRGGA